MPKPIARLTSTAQLVASFPLRLGYQPTESLIAICCHEPRGRMGLTMRFDLPDPADELALGREVERRVRQQGATRVVIAVFTSEGDADTWPRQRLVQELRDAFADLRVTEAVLVRDGRFWSYLCSEQSCCPTSGTPVDSARESSAIRLLEAEQVLNGQVVLADREALEATLAGPVGEAERTAAVRCEVAAVLLADAIDEGGLRRAQVESLRAWDTVIARFRTPPSRLGELEAAALAVSLADTFVRDHLAACPTTDVAPLLRVLEELTRRTPTPYDAAVCTLLAWVSYGQGGGSVVTIALERARDSDPDYSMAHLLRQALLAQVPPQEIRQITLASRELERGVG